MQHVAGCGCGEPDCCNFPPEFVRVRYYFGQRLGVMELSDQATYHAGKLAFHNMHSHGVGVLCGLAASRYPFTAGAKTTVLRVSRGAALDGCGREILVGVDQCIDVAAWAAKNKSRLSGWTAGSTQTLLLAVRYRECPSDPSPAPRDPCGCDAGGCEYGRVREGFELALFTPDEVAKRLATETFPDADALRSAIEGAVTEGVPAGTPPEAHAAAVDAAVHGLIAAACPDSPGDDADWLALAAFDVVLDAASPVPVDLSDPDNEIEGRRSLLSTSALQSLVLSLARDAHASGGAGVGPALGALSFTPSGATAGSFFVDVDLASKGTPPTDSPIVTATFDPAAVKLEVFDATSGWSDTGPSVTYNPSPSRIEVKASGLAADARYRLSIDQSFAAPVADDQGRALAPIRWVRLLALVADGSQLKLDPAFQET